MLKCRGSGHASRPKFLRGRTMNSKIMSPEELIEAIDIASQRAADHAVSKVMLYMGVNPEDPASLTRFRDNLTYLDQRRTSEAEARALIKNSVATILTTATISILAWAFIVFKGGFHDWAVGWLK